MIVPYLIGIWFVMMGIVAGVYGIAGRIPETQRRVTFESDRRLMAVALSHSTEYPLGGIVTIVLMIRIAESRTNWCSTQTGNRNCRDVFERCAG